MVDTVTLNIVTSTLQASQSTKLQKRFLVDSFRDLGKHSYLSNSTRPSPPVCYLEPGLHYEMGKGTALLNENAPSVRNNPFLNPDPSRIFLETELVRGIWDAFAVSPGHALLIPKRVVPTWFEATPEEQQALTAAITLAKIEIEKSHRPDGYNIGINAGAAAGLEDFGKCWALE